MTAKRFQSLDNAQFLWINAAMKSLQDVYSGKLGYLRVYSAIFVYSTNFRDIWMPCGVNWCIDPNSRCIILQAKVHSTKTLRKKGKILFSRSHPCFRLG